MHIYTRWICKNVCLFVSNVVNIFRHHYIVETNRLSAWRVLSSGASLMGGYSDCSIQSIVKQNFTGQPLMVVSTSGGQFNYSFLFLRWCFLHHRDFMKDAERLLLSFWDNDSHFLGYQSFTHPFKQSRFAIVFHNTIPNETWSNFHFCSMHQQIMHCTWK